VGKIVNSGQTGALGLHANDHPASYGMAQGNEVVMCGAWGMYFKTASTSFALHNSSVRDCNFNGKLQCAYEHKSD
jgi:hypothetical protein